MSSTVNLSRWITEMKGKPEGWHALQGCALLCHHWQGWAGGQVRGAQPPLLGSCCPSWLEPLHFPARDLGPSHANGRNQKDGRSCKEQSTVSAWSWSPWGLTDSCRRMEIHGALAWRTAQLPVGSKGLKLPTGATSGPFTLSVVTDRQTEQRTKIYPFHETLGQGSFKEGRNR